MNRRIVSILAALLLPLISLSAQDGFGFGFDDEAETEGGFGGIGGGSPAVNIGGEVSVAMTGFIDDFSNGADDIRFGDIVSAKLNFSAESSLASAVINLKLASGLVYYEEKSPVYVDEAYLTAWFGKLDLEAGLRKLTWGKADAFGPLDVINPLDNADLSSMNMNDAASLKIARPLVHASVRLGQFTKLEGVFVPWFEAPPLPGGRWAQAQMSSLSQLPVNEPDTTTLNYAQAGLRFTTTIANAVDIGAQYYYGRLTRPAVTVSFDASSSPPVPGAARFAYNPYHQIGVDYAQVLAGFNVRAELAANITEDLSDDDGAVYNPALAWSLGFDRDLVWGINLNAQCNETIRLLDNEITRPDDIEADSDSTATQVIVMLSKKFLRDELDISAAVLWEVEARDFFVMPGITWTKDDLSLAFSAGIFGGDEDGQFGQFRDNSFLKAVLTYTF